MLQIQNIKLAQDLTSQFTLLENLKSMIESKEVLKALLGTTFGFGFFRLSSHPRSKISLYNKVPKVKVKTVEVLPNLKLNIKNHVIHIHHWIWASAFLWLAFYVTEGWNEWTVLKGLLIGAIIQGLTYKNRFQILFRRDEAS